MNIIIKSLILTSMLALQSAIASEMSGEQTYKIYCAGCHGASGQGNGVCPSFVSDKERLAKSNEELLQSVRSGKGMMPPYGGMFSDEDILKVIEYLRRSFGDEQ